MTRANPAFPLRGFALPILLASILLSCRAPEHSAALTDPLPGAMKEIEDALGQLLDAAEKKDFTRLEAMHLHEPRFSKWDSRSPFRMDAEMTRRGERAAIESLEAFRPGVEDLKVDVFGRTAVATLIMPYEVVAGGQTSRSRVRGTLVWVKTDSGWKVAHEHFSAFPPAP